MKKAISVVHHINKQGKKVIISNDKEKTYDYIQYPFMILKNA